MEAKPLCYRVERASVTTENELDPIFPDLRFCLFRNIFGRLMLMDEVIVNVFLFTGSYSLISNLTIFF